MPSESGRWEAVWIGLLALAQLADVVTTGVDLAKGNVEANPQAAAIMSMGGLWLLWLSKLLLVAAISIVLLLTRRGLRQLRGRGRVTLMLQIPHFVAMRGTQLSVFVLTAIALQNLLLLPGR